MLLLRFEKILGNASATFFTKGVELKYNDFHWYVFEGFSAGLQKPADSTD